MSYKENRNNIRNYGDQGIMKERKIPSASFKEIIREAGTEEEEDECIKQKFKERAELVDKDARVNIKKIQMIACVMKCYYG